MKILLLGAKGQLGQELKRILPSVGEVKACGRDVVDLANHRSITATIEDFQPDVIVNAAAYTAVDKAESEQRLAFQVNAEAVAVLADETAKRDIWLIHYSTDYVFNGSKQEPYLETDAPNPVNIYGASKLAGEQAITASDCKHLIFRTTWVIGQHGHNFAKTILRLAKERNSLNVINDQFGVPTTPILIAKVTSAALEAISSEAVSTPWPTGVYHLVPHGETSWFGIAQTLLQLAKQQKLPLATNERALYARKTKDYSNSAPRPTNSLLDTTKLEQQLNFNLPHWKVDFCKVANEIIKEFKSV